MKDLHSLNFDVRHYRLDQLKRFDANDDRSKIPNNEILLHNLRLWNSAINIAKLLLKIQLSHRKTFFKYVLIPILKHQFGTIRLFRRRCIQLMRRRSIKLINDNNFDDELREVYETELTLKRKMNDANPQHNQQQDEIAVIQIDRVCSKCLRTENVTKCCTHCHRYFDEACFADYNRNNDDPENLCPNCHTPDAVIEHTVPSCETCKRNLPVVDADNFYKCIFHECTVSYHPGCVPAGAHKLSITQMICPRHNDPKANSDQLNICRGCCENRTSIKCTFCPLTFHSRKCLGLTTTRNIQIECEMCNTGRIILEGDYIFALYKKKWWPAKIVSEIDVSRQALRTRTMPERNRSGYFWIQFLETQEFKWKHQSDVLMPRQINDDIIMAIRGNGRKELFDRALSTFYDETL